MASTTAPASLDPFLPLDEADRHRQYGKLRALSPAVRLEGRDVWLVSRYDAVRHVLRHHDDFVSGLGTGYLRASVSGIRGPLIDSDPPDHTRIRRSVQRSFNRSWVAQRRRFVRAHVDALVDDAVWREHIDAATAIARPLPALVLHDLLGLEHPDAEELAAMTDSVFHLFGPEPALEHAVRVAEGITWLQEDAIPTLPDHCLGRTIIDHGGDNGDQFAAERPAVLFSIWVAGIDTTTNLVTTLLQSLAANPVQWQLLKADPGLADAAVEEAMRHQSPIRFFMRRTVEPVDLMGVEIPADADVCALFASANRDPAHYEEPDRFEIRRNPIDHLAFGSGIHHCLGAPLLRLEVVELLRSIVERVDRIELDGDAVRNPSAVMQGWTSLPIRLVRAS